MYVINIKVYGGGEYTIQGVLGKVHRFPWSPSLDVKRKH